MKLHLIKLNRFQLYHGHLTISSFENHVIKMKKHLTHLKHFQKYFEDSMAASAFAEAGDFDYARQISNNKESNKIEK